MIQVIVFGILLIVSYLIGCFSTARLLAKTFRSLNIYKVGTGHPDTENIYKYVDKILGIFSGLIDFSKIFIYLGFLNILLGILYPCLATQNHLMILGFFMIIGHCLPVTHHFRGGRGIFTYFGFVSFLFFTYFTIWPMIVLAILAGLIIILFKQIRFTQYMIVLLPPFISFFLKTQGQFPFKMFIAAISMGILNFLVSKKMGEI